MIVTTAGSVRSRNARDGAGGARASRPPGWLLGSRRAMAEGGPGRLLALAAARVTAPVARWGRLCFFHVETRETAPPPEPWSVREARAGELPWSLDPERRAEVADRFALGHRCFVVAVDGRVVSSVWSARRRARIPEVGLDVVPGPDESYAYDGYSEATWRRSGAFRSLRDFVLGKLREDGVRRIHFYVRGDNPSRRRRIARWASRSGTLWYVEPRGGRCRVSIPRSPRLPAFAVPATAFTGPGGALDATGVVSSSVPSPSSRRSGVAPEPSRRREGVSPPSRRAVLGWWHVAAHRRRHGAGGDP